MGAEWTVSACGRGLVLWPSGLTGASLLPCVLGSCGSVAALEESRLVAVSLRGAQGAVQWCDVQTSEDGLPAPVPRPARTPPYCNDPALSRCRAVLCGGAPLAVCYDQAARETLVWNDANECVQRVAGLDKPVLDYALRGNAAGQLLMASVSECSFAVTRLSISK